jgi:hypothetical protein
MGTMAEGAVIVGNEHSQASGKRKDDRRYEPDILPKLRSLLAILADIDVAHGSNLIVIESRPMDDASKDQLIADLSESHRRQRAPYLQEIEALRARMDAALR